MQTTLQKQWINVAPKPRRLRVQNEQNKMKEMMQMCYKLEHQILIRRTTYLKNPRAKWETLKAKLKIMQKYNDAN